MTIGLRHLAAAAAIAGATAVFAGAGTASAMPTDYRCTAGQVDTTLVPGDPGAGQRYAYVQFTAKPGVSCNFEGALPVTLTGADGIAVQPTTEVSPVVTIEAGQSATMLLHWTGIEAPENQVTPASVTVTAPGTTDPRGVDSDPHITLPWNQGPLDDSVDTHSLDVGAVTAGAAPVR
ncbi:DUF4232 domain-containing protein [Amycolatopsis sp. PS_44_ISF1]|uniref:DUF4232 domain-containing protein n=1 Tax=Amycolatopsis sp. PS_44_ISF1 TaxID=2974917 RepID=UPI0028E066E0|nr:DUF4232 domain-containing protein [Amycolatopsis sp. PS_44_ISF1]MDT8911433.1 DUF4232 domain-containing protein [Amycolatopsis sp. PS_44_ISF1]